MDLLYLAGVALFFALAAGLIALCYRVGAHLDSGDEAS